MPGHDDIRIGTLVKPDAAYIKQVIPHGFETVSITFWKTIGTTDLNRLAAEVAEVLEETGVTVSSVGVFGNPLMDDADAAEARRSWAALIDAAPRFGCDIVCGFTGRLVDRPIDESMKRFGEVFRPLAEQAAGNGVRLAFENCDMGGTWQKGDWNVAHGPAAWEMMFNELPLPNVGLEWEPCHQLVKLADPMPQLRKWCGKIFHVHGKDATIHWDVLRENGMFGPKQWAFHRTPGFGDSNWTEIISELRRHGFKGSIDIEGWHDPVYKGEMEMTGQVHGMQYLKKCRGGGFAANPV